MTMKITLLIFILIIITAGSVRSQEIVCGDVDGDGLINLMDITYLIKYLYYNGPAPPSPAAADVDVSGQINILDATYLIDFLYMNGPEPCPESPWPDEQLFLFDVWFVRMAPSEVMIGFCIDTVGQIRYYYCDPVWQPENPDSIALDELWDKYEVYASVIDTINVQFLRQQFIHVKPAREGPLSDAVEICANVGIYYYFAYEYHSPAERYIPVLLNQAGDTAQKNFHPSAEYLYDWLQTISDYFNDPPCQYPD